MSTTMEPPPAAATEVATEVSVEQSVREALAGATNANYDRVMARLADHCLALKVTVRGATHERKIEGAEVSVGGEKVDSDTVGRSTGLAMPPKVRTRLHRVADQIRCVPARYGTRFPGGAHLIPLRAGDRRPAEIVLSEIARLRDEYAATAAACRAEWEEYVEALRTKNLSVYTSIRRTFPTGEAFVAAHKVETLTFPLGRSLSPAFWERARGALGEHLDGAALADTVRRLQELSVLPDPRDPQADARWAREQADAAARMVTETVTNMVAEPVEELRSALAHLENALASGRNIRQGSLDALRSAWDKLTAFGFMLPADFGPRTATIGDRLAALTTGDVNHEGRSGSRELRDFFRDVREQVTGAGSIDRMAGQAMRGLALD